ncbi:membrane hypothetical protein [uncultured Desulfovibrio sp.]|uniref:Uncharacterized protein n=1 Tax=uncultured Desulfovibrio sp. TaxID=167968 RepID=A0A212L238_9BACT|nr:membrane hypothetical protein [uncultured Desulfovibrio sp.]
MCAPSSACQSSACISAPPCGSVGVYGAVRHGGGCAALGRRGLLPLPGLALLLALGRALLLALAAVPRLAVSVLAIALVIALIIALRRHAHGRPPRLRHVFLHVLWIALLLPLLFVRKDVGLFIGSLVEGGRGIGLAIGWAVWLTIGLAIRLPIGLAVSLIVSLIISGAVALSAMALTAIVLIAVSIVVAARCGLALDIALPL